MKGWFKFLAGAALGLGIGLGYAFYPRSVPGESLPREITFEGLDYSRLDSSVRDKVRHAEIDFIRLFCDVEPVYARKDGIMTDGGSITYSGNGYVLVRLHRVTRDESGIMGLTKGVEIRFDSEITNGKPVVFTKSYYVPFKK